MSNQYGVNRYKQTSITTASRGQVIVLLYEGCIKFLRKAASAIQEKKIADKGIFIGKAQDIINELNNALNHAQGGEISKELEKLYNYMFEQTTEANLNSDAKPLEVCIKLLETLLDGWRVAISKSPQEIQAQNEENMNAANAAPRDKMESGK